MRTYREFNCEECGRKTIDKSVRQNGKYCSPYCNKRAYLRRKGKAKDVIILCKYNEGVACDSPNCYGCGWHPDVEKKRKELLV